MRIFFDIGHPGHFHFFKNTVKKLKTKHSVYLIIREKDNSISYLVKPLGVQTFLINPAAKGFAMKAYNLIRNDISLVKISKKINPDLFVSLTSPYSAHASKVRAKPHITFADTEDAKLILKLTIPFTDVVITEDSYLGKLSLKKHISLHTWRPLAYLHPKYFTPRKEVLDMVGLSKDEAFFLLRFSALEASHDWGVRYKQTWKSRMKMIKTLEQYGIVFITSETKVPHDAKRYMLSIPPTYYLDLLAFSRGYIGEGGTTARESVALGKPTIHIKPEQRKLGVFEKLVKQGFLLLRQDYSEITQEDIQWFLDYKSRENAIMGDIEKMVDFNEFMVWFLENYPESKEIMSQNSNYQQRFKF